MFNLQKRAGARIPPSMPRSSKNSGDRSSIQLVSSFEGRLLSSPISASEAFLRSLPLFGIEFQEFLCIKHGLELPVAS